MGMPVELLPTLWVWSSHLLYGVLLWLAIRQVDWLRLRERRTVQHLCGGGVLLLSLLWQLRSGLLPGLEIGLLGLTALTLVMGWSFAVVVSSVALLIGFLVDRKSTRLNSSHVKISYAVFCLKKKN